MTLVHRCLWLFVALLLPLSLGCFKGGQQVENDANVGDGDDFLDSYDRFDTVQGSDSLRPWADLGGQGNDGRSGEGGVEVGSHQEDIKVADIEESSSVEQPVWSLNVLVLTTAEVEVAHDRWQDVFSSHGIGVTLHSELAYQTPSAEELRTLSEGYDVALVVGQGAAQADASPGWNDLAMGLVTTEAGLANQGRWHWLDVGEVEPTARLVQELTVEDPHSVLYGLSVGDRAMIAVWTAARAAEFTGFRRTARGLTDMGFRALSFAGEGSDAVYEQFVLWEPGPFFSGGAQVAAARRALFGLEADGVWALNAEGTRLLAQTLQWAARDGYPRRLDATFDPVGLLLTWQGDPSTTMTIDWHTLPAEAARPSKLRYWPDGSMDKRIASGSSLRFPHSDRSVHRAELRGLKPDTTYLFDFGDDSRLFRFRTMPTRAKAPIHFITGGDVRHTMEMMTQTSFEAHRHSPAFIAWGGDLAYANGQSARVSWWYDWFASVKNTLINGEGRVIPVIVAIGNHEVQQGYYSEHEGFEPTEAWRRQIAPFFYDLFAFPGQPGYDVLDFGDYMSWVILDTNHTNPIEGAQTEWLASVLRQRRGVPHVFPLYHVPAYPSVRGFIEVHPRSVREHFVPLFEAHGIRTAFENHDHTYKRTEPIRDNAVAADGIVYLGDGAWGVTTRPPRTPEQEWYLAASRGVRHFIVGTVDGDEQLFRAFDEEGMLFDSIRR